MSSFAKHQLKDYRLALKSRKYNMFRNRPGVGPFIDSPLFGRLYNDNKAKLYILPQLALNSHLAYATDFLYVL